MKARLIRVKYDPEKYHNGGFVVTRQGVRPDDGPRPIIAWTGGTIEEAMRQGMYLAWLHEASLRVAVPAVLMLNHHPAVSEIRKANVPPVAKHIG